MKHGRVVNRMTAAFLSACMLLAAGRSGWAAEAGNGPVYSVIEISFTGPTLGPSDAPARDVDFTVRFRHESGFPEYLVHGFWDGNGSGSTTGNVFKVRFCPTKVGRWNLVEVSSNRAELNGEKQGDYVTATSSSNHGFWIPEGRWYRRSDGTHDYIVGNTHYDFLSRPNGNEATASSIQQDITGNATYFKKLRFCLMSPRSENASSTLKPFFDSGGNPTHTESDRPNPKYFRERVDAAVSKGFEKDLICDLILGGTTGDQVADKQPYMKYVVARYGAYPNVWFCLANEWNEQASTTHEKNNGNYMRGLMAYPTPMSTHGTGGWNSGLNGSWCDHSIRQLKTGNLATAADGMISDYGNNGGKPAVNDENGYDPNEASTADVVEGITGSLAGGGYGTTGHKAGSKQGGYFWGHAARGKSITEHPSTSHLKFLREKVDAHVSFWKMTPKGAGSSIFSGANSGFRVLEWSGNQYVLLSDGADSSVTAALPSGTWKVVRLDVWAKSESTLTSAASGSYTFSTPSSRACLTVFTKTSGGATAPSAPSGLGALAVSTGAIDLSWQDTSGDEDGFRIERSSGGSPFSQVATVGPNVTAWSDTGLSAGTTYSYRVRAYNPAGNSAYSNTASATTDTLASVAITGPSAGTVLAPGETVTATGTGTGLSWAVDRLNDGQGDIATGAGSSITFTVPLDSTSAHQIRITLTGDGGSDVRTYDILDAVPTVTTVSGDLGAATVGVPYSDDIEATGGDAPLTWSAANLPPGLSLAASGGTLGGTPTTAGDYTFTVTVTDQDGDSDSKNLTLTVAEPAPTGGLIGNLQVSTGGAYEIDTLEVGKAVFIDRAYTFSVVPAGLVGKEFIRTANDDKSVASANYLTFTVSGAATVYVAFDDRVSSLPAWLDDGSWTLDGAQIDTTDVLRRLYRKEVAAGTVTLGGNGMAPVAGAGSNYNVVVVPLSGTPPPPPNQAPAVSITLPADGATFLAPADVTIQASAGDPDGAVAQVEFFADGNSLGTDTSAPWTLDWSGVAPGTYTLAAIATDDGGATGSSALVSITVFDGTADSDGDGMSDGWEIQFGLDPNDPSDAGGDLDGDGATNLEEHDGGSDPTDPSSTPAALTVTIDAVSTGRPYSLATASVGQLAYIDRSYTITSLTPALDGGVLVRTANNDKSVSAANHLTLSVTAAATVYVCYDKRGTAPGWLNDGTWTIASGEAMSTTDGSAAPLRIYAKAVSAGSLTLGGNHAGGDTGARSNYLVVIQPPAGAKAAPSTSPTGVGYLEGPIPAGAWDNPGDSDGDGLVDTFETGRNLDPGDPDTSNDGIPDESEPDGTGRTMWDAQQAAGGVWTGGGPGGSGSGDAKCGATGLEVLVVLLFVAVIRVRR